MTKYHVHIGDTDRNWLRIEEVEAEHSFKAAKLSGVSSGEHILRVATPEQDRRICERDKVELHEIYGLHARNDELTGGGSLTNDLTSIKNHPIIKNQ